MRLVTPVAMRMVWFLGCLVTIATARAQPAPVAPGAAAPLATEPKVEPEVEVEVEHYGWQIVIADAATTVLFVNGQGKPGLAMYALGGPIIHGAHEQVGRSMASLALRLGLPLLSAWTWGWYAHSGCAAKDDDCETDGAVAVGLVLGFATAMVLDATVLAHAEKPRRTARATWMPQVTATPQRVALGVVGRF